MGGGRQGAQDGAALHSFGAADDVAGVDAGLRNVTVRTGVDRLTIDRDGAIADVGIHTGCQSVHGGHAGNGYIQFTGCHGFVDGRAGSEGNDFYIQTGILKQSQFLSNIHIQARSLCLGADDQLFAGQVQGGGIIRGAVRGNCFAIGFIGGSGVVAGRCAAAASSH